MPGYKAQPAPTIAPTSEHVDALAISALLVRFDQGRVDLDTAVGLVRECLARRPGGISKYGVPLTTDNGRDAGRDVLDELVDAFKYHVQARREREHLDRELDLSAETIAAQRRDCDRYVADIAALRGDLAKMRETRDRYAVVIEQLRDECMALERTRDDIAAQGCNLALKVAEQADRIRELEPIAHMVAEGGAPDVARVMAMRATGRL